MLDAHAAAMPPDRVVAFVAARSEWSRLSNRSAEYWRRGAAIRVRDDGMWELDLEHDAVQSARQAVRERIAVVRRQEPMRPDSAVVEATRRRAEMERQANARRLARMRRVLIHPFPARSPEAIVLVDVGRREIMTFIGEEIAKAKAKLLADYDLIAAVDVRAVLRCLLALYEYGRLQGAVRLRWGFLDETIPAPWVHHDEPTLYNLIQRAHHLGVPLEVVVGSAPGWADPWSRAQRAYVEKDAQRWRPWLVDEQGYVIDEDQIQLARLAGPE